MKKILFSLVILFAGLSSANAQEGHFKVGAHIGLPVGNLSDGYSFNLGADVAYLWKFDSGFEVGATTGISNYFGKKVTERFAGMEYTFDYKDQQIIPLAATAKYSFQEKFFVGADLGYAFFLEGDDSGAFYYQPKVGYNFNQSEVYLGYKGMSRDGGSIGSINLGYAYNF